MAHPRQMSFFDGDEHPTSVNISIKKKHELVELTHIIDWPEFIELAMDIRAAKVKSNAGKEPHYREILGAIALIWKLKRGFKVYAEFNCSNIKKDDAATPVFIKNKKLRQ